MGHPVVKFDPLFPEFGSLPGKIARLEAGATAKAKTLRLEVDLRASSPEAYAIREWARGVVVSPYVGFLDRLEVIVEGQFFRFRFEGRPPHRDTLEPTLIRLVEQYSIHEVLVGDPIELLSRRFRRALTKATLHELDEAIQIHGERVFDPHRGGR